MEKEPRFRSRPRLSLGQVLFASVGGVGLAVVALLLVFIDSSKTTILRSSERLRQAAARRIETLVRNDLGVAASTIADLEREIQLGALDPHDQKSLEAALFSAVALHPGLAEATLTLATRIGFDDEGYAKLEPAGRLQLSVFRPSAEATSPILSRIVSARPDGYGCQERMREPGQGAFDVPFQRGGSTPDPTEHGTFRTTASQRFAGRALWSDLSWAQIDAERPPEKRRIVVTVQKAVSDRKGTFLGVLRVGLLTRSVDLASQLDDEEHDPQDPHRAFIADSEGRLISRLEPDDPILESDDNLRVVPKRMPPEIAAALKSPLLQTVSDEEQAEASGPLQVDGRRFLVSFRALPRTQGWIVGIVVPEAYYTHDLEELRDRFLMVSLLALVLLLAGGGVALRAFRHGLGGILAATERMRRFDFSAAPERSRFHDVQEVTDGLERAKTALRALGKYVPVDLVRELYGSNRDPELGGELRQLSILFTDLAGFTGLAEKVSADELARVLGEYLKVMTRSIREHGGTIDKFIGDAVMALWNAPSLRDDHARSACLSIVSCARATRELFASPAWGGLPPLITRFGLHLDRVMVGNFGSPDRLNYTAMGDGVNVASRLESLCKQYGTMTLVSESVVDAAAGALTFRAIDRVAVKGRKAGLKVYEIVAPEAGLGPSHEVAAIYEQAFTAYLARDFAAAAALWATQIDDPPSRVMLERTRELARNPPSADWDGVFVADSK